MRTQADINDLLQQLINSTAGQKVEYYGYAGECLSLAKRWLDVIRNGHLNGPMGAPPSAAWGSDYWRVPPAAVQELFDPKPYDPNISYPRGSMFVNTASHHIGILLDNQPGSGTARVYEQNADPDGSPAGDKQRAKSRIDGVLIIRTALPVEVPLYTTQSIDPKQVQVNAGSRKWNLAHGNFIDVVNNPITTATSGEVFIARAILHHREIPQYNYYLEDPNTPHGWNVLDCSDYVAPYVAPKPPEAPAAYIPAEKYELATTVPYYKDSDEPFSVGYLDALHSENPKGQLICGVYFVYGQRMNGMINLSVNNMKPGVWINPKDNVIAPPIVDVVTQVVDPPPVVTQPTDVSDNSMPATPAKPLYYEWLRGDRQPVFYHTLNVSPMRFKDLEKPDTVAQAVLPPNKDVRFSMVVIKNGMDYFIPTKSIEQGNRHGIPQTMLKEVPQAGKFDTNHDGKVSYLDFIDGISGYVDYGFKTFKPVIRKTQTFVKTNGKQFIDGFSKRKAK